MFAVTAVILCCACGGGGGPGPEKNETQAASLLKPETNSSTQEEAQTIVVAAGTAAAPMITSPGMFAVDVPIVSSVVVTYPGKINTQKPVLATLRSVLGEVSGDIVVEGGTIMFMPHAPLLTATEYVFSAETEVATTDGSWQKASAMVQFRTAATT